MVQALYSEQIEEQEQATQKFRKLLSRGKQKIEQFAVLFSFLWKKKNEPTENSKENPCINCISLDTYLKGLSKYSFLHIFGSILVLSRVVCKSYYQG